MRQLGTIGITRAIQLQYPSALYPVRTKNVAVGAIPPQPSNNFSFRVSILDQLCWKEEEVTPIRMSRTDGPTDTHTRVQVHQKAF